MLYYPSHTITLGSSTSTTVQSLEKDRVAHALSGHTDQEPRLAIFSRNKSGVAGKNSVANTTTKVVYGALNADGVSMSPIVIEWRVKRPEGYTDAQYETANDLARSVAVNEANLTAMNCANVLPYA